MVEVGPRARLAPYREGQNAIKEQPHRSFDLPAADALDVPALMASLLAWGLIVRKSIPPCQVLQFIGKISAIDRAGEENEQ